MFQILDSKNILSVSFSATLHHVDRVIEETKRFLSDHGAEEHIFDVTLALREGLINAVTDGNRLNEETPVGFSLSIDQNVLVMEIEDNGTGFDWRSRIGGIPAPEAESGRGLAIMGHYCDSVQYNDEGNKLTLKKNLRKGLQGASV